MKKQDSKKIRGIPKNNLIMTKDQAVMTKDQAVMTKDQAITIRCKYK
jgi:hypothetical protein